MDELSGFEGDQSQQGQGLAYVLPQSRTTGYFMQLANERESDRRAQAALLQQQQQKANEAYANHLYQFKTPEIANEYTKWLQPKFDDLLSSAAQYHASTGQDPFTNPDFIRQTNQLNTVAKSTDQANKRAVAVATAIADKSKNYTPESKQANIDWLQKYHSDPVSALYTPPPPLEERNLDLNDAVKLGHATANVRSAGGYTITEPNSHNHVVQGQAILSQPEFSPLLQGYGIDPHVGDIGGIPNGHGGTIYPTDAPRVNAIADQILQNAQQPHYTATLQAAGIDPADPHAKDKLVDVVTKQNAGYGKVLGDFRSRLDANVETKKVPDYGEDRLAISEANLDLARQRMELAKEKGVKDTTPIYRQKLVSDMLTGVPGSGETLTNRLKADPSYDPKTELGIKVEGDNIKFTIPARRKFDPKANNGAGDYADVQPSHVVTINKQDPNADVELNELVNQLTGEKVDISALRTVGGKKHLPTVQNNAGTGQHGKTTTLQQIQSKVGKPGFEGYTQQELVDYYKAQGYNIK